VTSSKQRGREERVEFERRSPRPRFGSTTMIEAFACLRCGALVAAEDCGRHRAWHEGERRAGPPPSVRRRQEDAATAVIQRRIADRDQWTAADLAREILDEVLAPEIYAGCFPLLSEDPRAYLPPTNPIRSDS
jgi:hypothetical protein